MSDNFDAEVDRYLEGELTPEQAVRVEERLLEPEASRALGRALLVRDFLRTQPPDSPPPGLVEYLQATLPAAAGAREPERSRWATRWAALRGANRAARGLGVAVRVPLSALGEPSPKVKRTMTFIKVLRFGASSMASALTDKPRPKPWWRRAVGWVR